jgi:hypothetical protein
MARYQRYVRMGIAWGILSPLLVVVQTAPLLAQSGSPANGWMLLVSRTRPQESLFSPKVPLEGWIALWKPAFFSEAVRLAETSDLPDLWAPLFRYFSAGGNLFQAETVRDLEPGVVRARRGEAGDSVVWAVNVPAGGGTGTSVLPAQSGGVPVLSAPTNSPDYLNSSSSPSFSNHENHSNHLNSHVIGSEPVIITQPVMPGFDQRGIDAYVPTPLPPPAGEGLLGGQWLYGRPRDFLLRNLLLFFGVHGFKGPTDLGHSGNFGFHEGLNWGAPLWEPWGWGVQLGMEATHSNFLGTQAVEVGFGPPLQMADRNQIFFTGAVFHRQMDQGMQGGLAVDLFYDHYYEQTTLCQLRSETSIVFSPYHELGYWGAYAVSRTAIRGFGTADGMVRPNDVFAVFYRRRFTGGGLGRIWTGLSSYGDLVLGLEGTVPLGTQWAIDNNFTCLFPKHGRSDGARPEENWSVSIHLVWYPGRLSNPVVSNPYHPLFYVADNSWFLVKRRP